jgi:catechol 2,3-dioxygenase-like lactoylglutathione lyase family enzyme
MTAFYGETLGLRFVKRYGSRPGAEYQAGDLTLAIMRIEDFGGTFSPNAMPITLPVSDVGVAREQLEAKGVRFVSETFHSAVGSRHPDGPTSVDFASAGRPLPEAVGLDLLRRVDAVAHAVDRALVVE